ncbi:MAG: MgtC/SapB family protein [Ilumatobacter sp.]|jgi:putative Mg2+ transporter-C (MgtC) family protein|uniref:MgtC/SapB family protein n=1 Tax=Ilumatobacter sp. TaxID=1967498 RepID=UPI003919D041
MTADLDVWEVTGRLALAALVAGIVGLQREYDGQDAGFRTHVLVAVGSALFGVVSVGAFDAFVSQRSASNVTVDVTRIAAYVAPGIGFIGGGAILKHGGRVSGITTAASLWSVAALGVAAGVGFWQATLVAGGITIVALALLRPVSTYVTRLGRRHHAVVALELDESADVGAIVRAITELAGDNVRTLRFGVGPGGGRMTVELWRDRDGPEPARFLRVLAEHDGIRSASTAANL